MLTRAILCFMSLLCGIMGFIGGEEVKLLYSAAAVACIALVEIHHAVTKKATP
jgi:hypothetical protein